MAPFGGWDMPIQYSSILAEARAVRSACGVFDVSHMGRLWVEGPGAAAFLQRVLTADVPALRPGRVRYCFILNEGAGIIDDCIITHLPEEGRYLLVCNAGNRPAVVAWLQRWMGDSAHPSTNPSLPLRSAQGFGSPRALRGSGRTEGVSLSDRTAGTVMLAVQGPEAVATFGALTDFFAFASPVAALRPFALMESSVQPARVEAIRESPPQGGPGKALVSRTGYTGEDGVEVVLPAADGARLWRALAERGVTPCGLGARDVLRLEAGLALHGNDLDATTTPLEAGLGRFVAETNTVFIGREALERQRASGVRRSLVGFRVVERGIPRHGYRVLSAAGVEVGAVTSGGYSPTLDAAIGMAYVTTQHAGPGTRLVVDIRGRLTPAEVAPLPFYSRKR
jgi:aminomethyltransferase